MVESPDWDNPLTILVAIFVGIITVMMVAGRVIITFMAVGGLGGLLVIGLMGFTMFKVFTEK